MWVIVHRLILQSKDYRNAKDGTAVIADDPWLQPYEHQLQIRFVRRASLLGGCGGQCVLTCMQRSWRCAPH